MAELSAQAPVPRTRGGGRTRRVLRHRQSKDDVQQATDAGLDLLRVLGWLVLHDVVVPGDPDGAYQAAIVDHLLAGPSGVYVVNTVKWPGPIEVKEHALVVGKVDRADELAEVGAAADAVRAVLHGIPVAPMLCFERLEPVTGVVADVALCASENILDLLTHQPVIVNDAAFAKASRTLGSVCRPDARRPDASGGSPRDRVRARPAKNPERADPELAEPELVAEPSAIDSADEITRVATFEQLLDGSTGAGAPTAPNASEPRETEQVVEQVDSYSAVHDAGAALWRELTETVEPEAEAKTETEPETEPEAKTEAEAEAETEAVADPEARSEVALDVAPLTVVPDLEAALLEAELWEREVEDDRDRAAAEVAASQARDRKAREALERIEQEALKLAEQEVAELAEREARRVAAHEAEVRAEQERLEQERLERERVEQQLAELARLEQERAEQERLEQERAEQERAELERLEQERLEQERVELERRRAEWVARAHAAQAAEEAAAKKAAERAAAEEAAAAQDAAAEQARLAEAALLEAAGVEAPAVEDAVVEEPVVEDAAVEEVVVEEADEEVVVTYTPLEEQSVDATIDDDTLEDAPTVEAIDDDEVQARADRVAAIREREAQRARERAAEEAADDRPARRRLADPDRRPVPSAAVRAPETASPAAPVTPVAVPRPVRPSHHTRAHEFEEPEERGRSNRALLNVALGALLIAAVVLGAPRVPDLVSQAHGLFAKSSGTQVGTAVVVKATSTHPDLTLLAGTPVNARATGGFKPPKGQHLVAVPLRITNSGLVRWDVGLAARVNVVDSGGTTRTVAKDVPGLAGLPLLPSQTRVPPGKDATGYVVFSVPDGQDVSSVSLRVSRAGGDTVTWQVTP
ncbi:hypothetical protein ACVW00_001045 [Marmoricola sp. URHA0025 HA25]